MNRCPVINTSICKALLVVSGSLLIAACVTITQPTKNSVITAPVPASITVRQYCDSFKVTLDGADVTAQFSPLPPGGTPSNATLANVSGGDHTLAASANTRQYWFLIPYCASDGASATFTVPLVVGLPADADQGNCTPFGGYSGRYQQVYSASAFPRPITIRTLKFFDTQSPPLGNGSMPSATFTIALSTTAVDRTTLSTNYAANVGANNTQVFSANLGGQPWTQGQTLTIPLSTPFTYNPANGNLLMDVTASNVSPLVCSVYFDTTGYDEGRRDGSTVTGHVDTEDGRTIVFSGYGLVTGFD